MKKIIALFAVAFSLAGCSANIQDLAAEGNWQEIGAFMLGVRMRWMHRQEPEVQLNFSVQ